MLHTSIHRYFKYTDKCIYVWVSLYRNSTLKKCRGRSNMTVVKYWTLVMRPVIPILTSDYGNISGI